VFGLLVVRPGMLWGLLALRPGDRLFRVQDEPLDSILDAWRLLCHTYGR